MSANQCSHLVRVKRNWFGAAIKVPENELSGLHVATQSGGVRAQLSRPILAAYMSCDAIPDGAYFEHSCLHGEGPHRIKVLIPKAGNARATYDRLASQLEAAA